MRLIEYEKLLNDGKLTAMFDKCGEKTVIVVASSRGKDVSAVLNVELIHCPFRSPFHSDAPHCGIWTIVKKLRSGKLLRTDHASVRVRWCGWCGWYG